MKTEYKGFTAVKHFQEAEQKYLAQENSSRQAKIKITMLQNHFQFLKKMSIKLSTEMLYFYIKHTFMQCVL